MSLPKPDEKGEMPTGSATRATPGHSAAAAALAISTPSRISLATVSPGRRSGLLTPHTKRALSYASDLSVPSAVVSDVEADQRSPGSSQELEPGRTSDLARNNKTAPSLSVDPAQFPHAPPASQSPTRWDGGTGMEDDEQEQQTATLERPPGVDFLTRRLRSAIGRDLLLEDSETEGDEGGDGSVDMPSGQGAEPRKGKGAVVPRIVDEQAEDVERASREHSVQQNEPKPRSASTGWGWSTMTTLPAALRIDNALHSLSMTGSGNGEGPSSSGAKDATGPATGGNGSTDRSGSTVAGYVNALDVRKWFGAPRESDPAQGDRQSGNAGKVAAAPTTAQRPDTPLGPAPAPLRGLPAGSFPSASVASRKKKDRERAQAESAQIEAAANKERKQIGTDVIEHDLTELTFGLATASSKDGKDHFPPHEYLVLSTAGKPVYWSKVSQARLNRARVNRERKRRQQNELEAQKAQGIDTKEEERAIEAREEALTRSDQEQQDEEDQEEATRVGMLQAVISNYAETDKVKLHATGKEVLQLPDSGRVCYLLRPPLYLVAVAQWDEAEATLRNHLEYLYQAIISLVSATKLNRLFDRAANFDLKRLLQGTDNILDALLTRLQSETIAMRGALQPRRLDVALRHDIGAALIPSRSKQSRPQDALYALLLTRQGIVTLARRRKHSIHPIDCHLMINTVLSTKALKEGGTQSWVPICLPKFAPQGFVYAHVSFLDAEAHSLGLTAHGSKVEGRQPDRKPELGLVLVTGNPDGFDEMSAWRERIAGNLQKDKLLIKLLRTTRLKDEDGTPETSLGATLSPDSALLSASYSADELGLAGLRHFCFKWRSNVQSTSPTFEAPYTPGTEEHKRLLYLYGLAHDYVVRSSKESVEKGKASGQASPAQSDGEARIDEESSQANVQSDGASETDGSSRASLTGDRSAIRGRNQAGKGVLTTSGGPSGRSTSPSILPRSVLSGKIAAKVQAIKPTAEPSRTTCMHLLRTSSEAVLAWSTPPFELYLTASPHLPRTALVTMAKAVVKWVKQEEHRLFIVSAPVF